MRKQPASENNEASVIKWTGCGMKAIMFKHLMEYYLDKAMCKE